MPQFMLAKRKNGDPFVALAFDHANIRIGDMQKMHAYTAAIEQNFADLEEDDATTQVAEVDITWRLSLYYNLDQGKHDSGKPES